MGGYIDVTVRPETGVLQFLDTVTAEVQEVLHLCRTWKLHSRAFHVRWYLASRNEIWGCRGRSRISNTLPDH